MALERSCVGSISFGILLCCNLVLSRRLEYSTTSRASMRSLSSHQSGHVATEADVPPKTSKTNVAKGSGQPKKAATYAEALPQASKKDTATESRRRKKWRQRHMRQLRLPRKTMRRSSDGGKKRRQRQMYYLRPPRRKRRGGAYTSSSVPAAVVPLEKLVGSQLPAPRPRPAPRPSPRSAKPARGGRVSATVAEPAVSEGNASWVAIKSSLSFLAPLCFTAGNA